MMAPDLPPQSAALFSTYGIQVVYDADPVMVPEYIYLIQVSSSLLSDVYPHLFKPLCPACRISNSAGIVYSGTEQRDDIDTSRGRRPDPENETIETPSRRRPHER